MFPSLAEGMGMPVAEAMSLGKPVFLSALTALPEIGGEAAFYFKSFEPSEVVKTYQEGSALFDHVRAQQLMQQASKFSWEETVKSYEQFYQQVAEKAGRK
jgi:glycosyltransferase involved in cell wall biosynthesis